MNELRLFVEACGLSQREAAEYLEVRRDTVDRALRGRDKTPAGWLVELAALLSRQRRAADEAYRLWNDHGRPGEIEIGVSSDDHEAQSLGWPCVGAHIAVIRLLRERLPDDVRLIPVPRGSTVATAAATDAHEK